MPRPANDDRNDATIPGSPQRPTDQRVEPPTPEKEDSGGEARDQGDQTEDNRKQQE
ncbi:hypothetical protein LZ009_01835 [Ramlibacter sp. XY19]|uniref:hypothetical protein n=1 Tax=Ramlibacter paludis TaxID=2908000 RepID=UPI0023D9D166|nr:hypothetical protein [Ramlibacter paludis]MCG2591521.1 hypothetical protein [Ramlibacter paludis]